MKNYSFLNTVLLVNGVEITGWAEGDDLITFSRRNDSMTDVVGASGEMAVSNMGDRSGELVFTLLQTSTSNTYMGGLLAAQENGLFVPTFVLLKDTLGGEIVSGSQGYIKKPADFTLGAGINTREWTIVLERGDVTYTQL